LAQKYSAKKTAKTNKKVAFAISQYPCGIRIGYNTAKGGIFK
jgi:hypothetical protein